MASSDLQRQAASLALLLLLGAHLGSCAAPPPSRPGATSAACDAVAYQRRRQGGILTEAQRSRCTAAGGR
jgi:hypothetical protein